MDSDHDYGELRRFARPIGLARVRGPGAPTQPPESTPESSGARADLAGANARRYGGPGGLLQPFVGLLGAGRAELDRSRVDLSYLRLSALLAPSAGASGGRDASLSPAGPATQPSPADRGEPSSPDDELRVFEVLDGDRDERPAERAAREADWLGSTEVHQTENRDANDGDAAECDAGDRSTALSDANGGDDAEQTGPSASDTEAANRTSAAAMLRTAEPPAARGPNGGLELTVATSGAAGSVAGDSGPVDSPAGATGSPPTTPHSGAEGVGARDGVGSRDGVGGPDGLGAADSVGDRDGTSSLAGASPSRRSASEAPTSLTVRSPTKNDGTSEAASSADQTVVGDAEPRRAGDDDGRSDAQGHGNSHPTDGASQSGAGASPSASDGPDDALSVLEQHDERRRTFVDELYRALERKRAIEDGRGPT